MFDIDGTLTDTCQIDAECYVASLAAVFGFPAELDSYAWADFDNVTDRGILLELLDRAGREASDERVADFEADFVARISAAFEGRPELCRPIRGAVELVGQLEDDPRWAVALATGGFRASALLKLARAGFDPPRSLASGSDSLTREAIVRTAIRRAEVEHEARFEAVVLAGDGLWDVRAARELGWPCIGVATGEEARALARAGATSVLPDFGEPAAARGAFERAATVARPAGAP